MTTTRTVDQPPVKVEARQPLAALLRARELPVSVALIALIAITFALNPLFLSPQGVKDLLLNATIMLMLAVGQAIVIITRNVDLSVGSMLGLVAFTVGTLFAHPAGDPDLDGLRDLHSDRCGARRRQRCPGHPGQGARTGVTLGTLYVFRGVNDAWAGGKQYFAGDRPVEFGNLSVNTFLGLPWITIVAIVVIAAAGIALGRTRAGRDLYAIGSDPAAALMFGIPVRSRVFTAFVVNGALTGLAAVLYASRFNSVGATTGSGLELEVVAAAVVGGVAIFGGSGTPLGAAIGALLLTTITSSLTALRVDKFWQQAIVGVLILASVMVDRIVSLRNARKLRLSEARNG